MKILIAFGTRPEAIKLAPLIKALEKETSINIRVCVTAQHREMLDQVLHIFDIKPEYDLDIMQCGQNLFDVTSKVLLGMRDVLVDFEPDMVIVHGDTTTSSIATLAAFYHTNADKSKLSIGHVEAGLRTNDIYNPWPEEANRQIISILADMHFVPTEQSKANLLKENKSAMAILVTGNTVIDALLLIKKKIADDLSLQNSIVKSINKQFPLRENSKIILVTGHRRENFGRGFLAAFEALKELSHNNPEVDIIYPVHLNPQVLQPARKLLKNCDNIHLIAPLEYMSFVYLMSISYFILTDSGGIQEEAPSLGKPVLVMRETTERQEAVSAGTALLVGMNKESIVSACQNLLDNKDDYKRMSLAHNPYGDGNACARIVRAIKIKYGI